jgi:hypothetical protein
MAKSRKTPDSNDCTQIKEFSPAQEIESAIQKLRRRIEDVQSLQRDQVVYNHQRVINATGSIRSTVYQALGFGGTLIEESVLPAVRR